ncbi:MAG: hypothetical protein PHS46_08420 [Candidatus Omnitrophica bacterium]|nr:hypothetical protein [Candidatus Omnitrophota bacterium]
MAKDTMTARQLRKARKVIRHYAREKLYEIVKGMAFGDRFGLAWEIITNRYGKEFKK